jgi:hypothetical protein
MRSMFAYSVRWPCLGIAVGPCAETIRQWLLRVGLFLLRRPLPRYTDWVYLLDLTIQLGAHKCLVILGISLAQFRSNGYRLDHHDVHVLSVHVLTRCTAQTVHQHLTEVRKRVCWFSVNGTNDVAL